MIRSVACITAWLVKETIWVEGDHGYILWTAETADNSYELGTDTFFVRTGR